MSERREHVPARDDQSVHQDYWRTYLSSRTLRHTDMHPHSIDRGPTALRFSGPWIRLHISHAPAVMLALYLFSRSPPRRLAQVEAPNSPHCLRPAARFAAEASLKVVSDSFERKPAMRAE